MLEFLVDIICWFLPEKSSSRRLTFQSVQIVTLFSQTFIRRGIHTVSALIGKDTVSISIQSHLQVHRLCIVYKQPRIRKLSGPDVSAELEIKDTTESITSASYLDLFCRLGRMVNFKGYDFNLHITKKIFVLN